MKKYNHAFSLPFSIDTDCSEEEIDNMTKEEIIAALLKRMAELVEEMDAPNIIAAIGPPWDSVENDT